MFVLLALGSGINDDYIPTDKSDGNIHSRGTLDGTRLKRGVSKLSAATGATC